MATKADIKLKLMEMGIDFPADALKKELEAILKNIEGGGGPVKENNDHDEPIADHIVRRLEAVIRRAVKRAGGFRKDVSEAAKAAARSALKRLGRSELQWNKNINLNMISTKSIVRPKKTKNSID